MEFNLTIKDVEQLRQDSLHRNTKMPLLVASPILLSGFEVAQKPLAVSPLVFPWVNSEGLEQVQFTLSFGSKLSNAHEIIKIKKQIYDNNNNNNNNNNSYTNYMNIIRNKRQQELKLIVF